MPNTQTLSLLCEGLEGAFFPEVAYVRQGDKTFFFKGNSQLCESVVNTTIVESLDALELEERQINGTTVKTVKGGKWFVEGPYQRSGVKNANGRVYGRKIWEKWVGDPKSPLMTNLKEGALVGHLEHPADGRTDGKEGAIAIRSLKLQEDGVVWGQSELLDTPNGLILQEYTRKNVRWGVSSRGTGTVKDDGSVNEEDYTPETWDAVMRPSVPGAFSAAVGPGKKANEGEEDDGTPPGTEELTEEATTLVEHIDQLREKNVEDLDESGCSELRSDLVAAMQQVNSLAKSDALPSLQAYDLQDWLTDSLQKIHLGESARVAALIDQTLDQLPGDGEEDEAFARVVESLQKRITVAVGEAETLRTRCETAEERTQGLEQERDVAWKQCEKLKEELATFRKRLSVAEDLIATHSEVEITNPIREAVEDAIRQVPGLAGFKDVLETAQNPDHVETLAEQLLPAVLNERTIPQRTAVPVKRPTLPRGKVVSESIPAASRVTKNPSPGARKAGAALISRTK